MHEPWLWLRIALFEMGEQLSVRQMLQTRGVVRHDIETSWEEASQVAVPVAALVSASHVAQASSGAFRCDGAFVDTRDGGSVVRVGLDIVLPSETVERPNSKFM